MRHQWETKQTDRLNFDEFGQWYNDGGFERAPWLELLDLKKWVLVDDYEALPKQAPGNPIGQPHLVASPRRSPRPPARSPRPSPRAAAMDDNGQVIPPPPEEDFDDSFFDDDDHNIMAMDSVSRMCETACLILSLQTLTCIPFSDR